MVEIRDGLVPVLTSVAGSPLRIAPGVGSWHYSVIAVDARGNSSPF